MTLLADHPLRTEVEVATDTVMLLVAASVIPRRPDVMVHVAQVLGITVQDLREADSRCQRGYARPPESRSCLPPAEPPARPHRPELTMRTQPESHEHRPPAPSPTTPATQVTTALRAPAPSPTPPPPAPVAPTPSPAPVETADKRVCSRCSKPRDATADFRGGSTVCKLCVWRKARRTRFLAEWAAHTLTHDDKLLGHPCGACGKGFRVGQRVFAYDVQVAHEKCPAS